MQKVLITAGRTTEKIDGIRGITNFATGSLGFLLVEEFLKIPTIDEIFFLTSEKPHLEYFQNSPKVKTYWIFSSQDLSETSQKIIEKEKIDIILPTMAVSDFTPQKMVSNKELVAWITSIKDQLSDDFENNQKLFNNWLQNEQNQLSTKTKIDSSLESTLFLAKVPKIIKQMRQWAPQAYLVGFKLLVNVDEESQLVLAKNLIQINNYDLIVINDWTKIDNNQHHALIVNPENSFIKIKSKTELAKKIVTVIVNKKG